MARCLAAVVAALTLAASACGGGGGGGGSGYGGGGSAGGSAKSSKADKRVTMKNIQFVPRNLTVSKGQTVEWTNDDSVTHNVTKEKGPGPDFKSSNINGGGTYRYTFATAGKFDYVCTIHPNQRGTISVK